MVGFITRDVLCSDVRREEGRERIGVPDARLRGLDGTGHVSGYNTMHVCRLVAHFEVVNDFRFIHALQGAVFYRCLRCYQSTKMPRTICPNHILTPVTKLG